MFSHVHPFLQAYIFLIGASVLLGLNTEDFLGIKTLLPALFSCCSTRLHFCICEFRSEQLKKVSSIIVNVKFYERIYTKIDAGLQPGFPLV